MKVVEEKDKLKKDFEELSKQLVDKNKQLVRIIITNLKFLIHNLYNIYIMYNIYNIINTKYTIHAIIFTFKSLGYIHEIG